MSESAVCASRSCVCSGEFRRHRRAAAPAPFPWDVRTILRRGEPEKLPMGGLILRGALTDDEQRWLYGSLNELADPGSAEIDGLRRTASRDGMSQLNADNRPQPLVTWVHPYTRGSNARCRPTELLEWAQRLMHALVPAARGHVVDSMLAQMYAPGGSLLPHRDADLSWGLGVSLGAAAEFDCLPENGKAVRVMVRSGDILLGEFGQMRHSVRVTEPPPPPRPPAASRPGASRQQLDRSVEAQAKGGSAGGHPASYVPEWWRSAACETYGTKTRCNVLFRQALTEEQQIDLAEARSRSIYGMPLDELCKKTGHDKAYLSVHLRHQAVE